MNELEMSDLTGIDDDRILKDPGCLIPVPATGCTPLQPVGAASRRDRIAAGRRSY